MPLKCESVFPMINERLAKVDKNNRKVVGIFQYNITVNGAVAKNVYLDLINLKIVEGTADKADVTTTIEDDDFIEVIAKKKDLTELVGQGKAQVTGDIELYKKLGAVI